VFHDQIVGFENKKDRGMDLKKKSASQNNHYVLKKEVKCRDASGSWLSWL